LFLHNSSICKVHNEGEDCNKQSKNIKKGENGMNRKVKLLAISTVLVGILVLVFAGMVQADGPRGLNNGEWIDCEAECGGWQNRGAGIASETVSELLGLTHEEIEAQRSEGISLVEIAAAQGVSEDTLVEAINAAKKEALQERVAAGFITQEQADLMLQQMEQRTVEAVNRTTIGPPEDRGYCGYGKGEATGSGTTRGMGRWGGRGACYDSVPESSTF
jgi:hypothetical protein